MEINADFIAIQGILTSILKTTGDFTKIKYKGGNELKIHQITQKLEEFLESKGYICKKNPTEKFSKQLEDICFFLCVNLEFHDGTLLDDKAFSHLIGIIPPLSQCLLANIVVDLNLAKQYCEAMRRLPFELYEELLIEIVPCLKKIPFGPSIHLTYYVIACVIIRVITVDHESYRMREIINRLEGILTELLFIYSRINPETLNGVKKNQIYEMMGYVFMNVLKLFDHCNFDQEHLLYVNLVIVNSAASLMKAITIDVYCLWAEIDYEEASLQSAISEEAYFVIEKLQNFKQAKDLCQMLSTIAKRPLTIQEQIMHADVGKMIQKIKREDENCKKWFTALLNTNVFENKEALACVRKNSKLCDSSDVLRLLNLLKQYKTKENVDLVVGCAENLSTEELKEVVIEQFYQRGIGSLKGLNDVVAQLVLILNQLDSQKKPEKEIILLLLQDPEVVLNYLYRECVRNDLILGYLTETFDCIASIVEIDELHLKCLNNLLEHEKLTMDNLERYKKLFGVIAKRDQKVVNGILESLVCDLLDKDDHDSLRSALRLLIFTTPKESVKLLNVCFSVMEKTRWTMFDFTNAKADLCQEALNVVISYRDDKIIPVGFTSEKLINSFYLTPPGEDNFIESVCPPPREKRSELICHLIKVLPMCLSGEWAKIYQYLVSKYSHEEVLSLLTEVLVLICGVVKTQGDRLLSAFKFCVQNYGLIVQNNLVVLNDEQVNKIVAVEIIKLLKELPEDLDLEGMSLASILPENTLKSLRSVREFVLSVVTMRDSPFSKSIAKKML